MNESPSGVSERYARLIHFEEMKFLSFKLANLTLTEGELLL